MSNEEQEALIALLALALTRAMGASAKLEEYVERAKSGLTPCGSRRAWDVAGKAQELLDML
jgi:hypothetical protein